VVAVGNDACCAVLLDVHTGKEGLRLKHAAAVSLMLGDNILNCCIHGTLCCDRYERFVLHQMANRLQPVPTMVSFVFGLVPMANVFMYANRGCGVRLYFINIDLF
jgi:hypothetical protein